MAYYVNLDLPTNRAIVHTDSCEWAKVREKLPMYGSWSESIRSFSLALAVADLTGARLVRGCLVCRPGKWESD